MFKIKFKVTFLVCILFAVLLANPVFSNSEEDCVMAGGEWVVPVCDAREGDCIESFCRCQKGFRMENYACVKISDNQLCINSDGRWVDDACICPENSIGWNNLVGCDYKSSIAQDKGDNQDYIIFLTILTIILVVFIIILLIILRRNKNEKTKN